MSKANKDTLIAISLTIFLIYMVMNAASVGTGAFSRDYSYNGCEQKWRRFDVLMPGFRIGCWLGSDL